MVRELARPVVLLGCILSLLGLFHVAFLEPAANVLQRLDDAVGPLLVSAAMALVGGMVFISESNGNSGGQNLSGLWHTFPVRVFVWALSGMVTLFLVAWYIETHCIFYRAVRY